MARMILGAFLAALVVAMGGAALAQEKMQQQDRDRIRDPTTHQPAAEPDQLRSRDADRDRIHELLRTDGGLTPEQLTAAGPDVDQYLGGGGDADRLQETLRAALENGCRGECLSEAVRQTNRLMARGYAPVQAGETVRAALQEEARTQERRGAAAGTEADAAAAQRLRARIEDRMRDRDLDRDRTRDQDRERERDRDMTHQPGGPSGSRGGR